MRFTVWISTRSDEPSRFEIYYSVIEILRIKIMLKELLIWENVRIRDKTVSMNETSKEMIAKDEQNNLIVDS